MLYIVLAVLTGFILSVVIYKLIKSSNYWHYKNIVHEPAWPIIGNMGNLILGKKHAADITIDLYKKYPNLRYVGFMEFNHPTLMIRDLDLIKQLTIKYFDNFHDHTSFAETKHDIVLNQSLSFLKGKKWHRMRVAVSPLFTSSKRKIIYQQLMECGRNLFKYFESGEPTDVDINDVFCRFTVDGIVRTIFGIPIDSLEDPKNSFFEMSKRFNSSVYLFAKIIIMSRFPALADFVGAQLFPKDVIDFFRSITADNITYREKNGILRPDLVHLLMQARKARLQNDAHQEEKTEGFATVDEYSVGQSTEKIDLTDDDITAQTTLFFFAGFENLLTMFMFLAYELAIHPHIQTKLQEEIDGINRGNGEITYEALLSMKYFDQVVSEILRLWPPAFQTDRVCTKDFTIQPESPNEKGVLIEKGVSILVPIIAIHRDPQYFPEPEKFDPERFSHENKAKIVPGSYIPFGLGPRNCVGSRFALLEIKIFFFHLLTKFDIVPTNDTHIPVKLNTKHIAFRSVNNFKLKFSSRLL